MTASTANACPCQSKKTYATCCEPLHEGKAKPKTAEQLMRARYSAFVKQRVDYIKETVVADQRAAVDDAQLKAWAEQSKWLGFEVLQTEGGGATDDAGMIEFVARYEIGDQEVKHHEFAQFVRKDGEWYFDSKNSREAPPDPLTVVHAVGRNDPCPCGSGKKHKKCCGA